MFTGYTDTYTDNFYNFCNIFNRKKTTFIGLTIVGLALSIASCSLLKPSQDNNCLNPASTCFVRDVTAPSITDVKIHQTSALEGLAVGTTVSTLYAVDITYSEKLRNADDLDAISFTSGVGDTQLSFASAQNLSGNQWRYFTSDQNGVRNGAITITSTAVDYTGKSLNNDALHPINIIGSTNVAISLNSVSSYYLTTGQSAVIKWQHDYEEEISSANGNEWWVTRDTTCNYGNRAADSSVLSNSTNVSGTNLDLNVEITTTIALADLPAETSYEFRICVRNEDNNKEGFALITLTKDLTDPTSFIATNSLAGGIYKSQKTVTLQCSDTNCSKIVYTVDGSTPTVTGTTITNGLEYTSPWTTPYTVDPTTTTLKWLAVDLAGNQQSAVQTETYTIDSRVPEITINSVGAYTITSNAGTGRINSSTINFTSSLNGKYIIRKDGSTCSSLVAGDWATPTGTLTGGNALNHTIHAATGTDSATDSYISGAGSKTIRICVQETVTTTDLVAGSAIVINVDNSVPTFAGLETLTVNGSNFELTWPAAIDNSGIIYKVYESLTAFPGTHDYTTETPILQTNTATTCTTNSTTQKITCVLTGRNVNTTTYHYNVQAVDLAGNPDANNVQKFNSFQVTASVSGLSGTFNVSLGGSSQSFSSNSSHTFSQLYTSGQTATISISSQPDGQICSVSGKQQLTINGNITVTIRCVNGYMVGGTHQTVQASPLKYHLYRGKATILHDYNDNKLARMAYTNNGIYFIRDNAIFSTNDFNNPVAGDVTTPGNIDATGTSARFNAPMDLVSDGSSLYIADNVNKAIRKMDLTTNEVTTVYTHGAKTPMTLALDQVNQVLYFVDSTPTAETLNRISLLDGSLTHWQSEPSQGPRGLIFLNNSLYLVNSLFPRIVRYNPDLSGRTFFAGNGSNGFIDGACLSSELNRPWGITTDGKDLYVTEYNSHKIRRIVLLPNGDCGRVQTIAGSGTAADLAGTGAQASFSSPHGIVSDGRRLYVATTGGAIMRIVDDGLVGHWPLASNLNEYSGENAASVTGTVTGSVTLTETDRYGANNSAYYWDGNSRIVYPSTNLPMGNSPRSACIWVKPKTGNLPGTNQDDVFFQYGVHGTGQTFALVYQNINNVRYVTVYGWGSNLAVPFILDVDKWTHLCTTYDSQDFATLYINGKAMGQSKLTNWNTSSSGELWIGQRRDLLYRFTGGLADLRIYNRVLNEGEIHELANDAASNSVSLGYSKGPIGLLSHWNFNEDGSAPSLGDRGPLNISLTNNGGANGVVGKEADTNGAYDFSGTGQDLSASSSSSGIPRGGHPRTMCVWFKPDSYPLSGAWKALGGYGTAATNEQFYLYLRNNSGTGEISVVLDVFDTEINSGYKPPLNSWTHACVSVNTLKLTELYINGSRMATATLSGLDTGSGNFFIGSAYGTSQHYDGTIDDVRVYNNALSDIQIRSIASQIPNGLVARYDFSHDINSVAGWEADLNPLSSDYTWSVDKFGVANASVSFDGGQHKLTTTNATILPQGNNPRTMCAWFYSEQHPASGNDSIVHHGTNTANGGHVLTLRNTGTLNLTAGFWGSFDAVLSPYRQYPAQTWQFICSVHSSTVNMLYLNGVKVDSRTANNLNINSANLYIGIDASSSYFHGRIDEVTIYNRVLSGNEIVALTNQPNKKLYLTVATYTGNMGGIAGADANCGTDAGYPGSGVYKAMLADGSTRIACSNSNCETSGLLENRDWVLRPSITYVKADGVTPIYTINSRGIFDFSSGSLINSVHGSARSTWTGMDSGWRWNAINCSGWTQNGGGNGYIGDARYDDQRHIFVGQSDCTSVGERPLYCVEQ